MHGFRRPVRDVSTAPLVAVMAAMSLSAAGGVALADAQTLADFKAVWTGDTALDAGDYTYTASVNVTAN